MSAQTMAEAFAPVMARYKAQIEAETWGHLAPKRNKIYRGFITFTFGVYGCGNLNVTVLHMGLEDLDDSPWFYDALREFLEEGQGQIAKEDRFEVGSVYRFDGQFRNYEFKGTFTKVFDATKE